MPTTCDTNDCVVRAFKTAAQVRYEDAHAACELLGRKRNHGIGTANIIDRAMDLLDRKAEIKFDYMANGFKKITLRSFTRNLPSGRYVATIAHHAFPITVVECSDGRTEAVAFEKPLARLKKVWLISPKA